MSDNRKLSNDINVCGYNTLSAIINYNYSVKNNYDFKYLVPTLYNKIELYNCYSPSADIRHAAWSKILSVLKIINTNEYTTIVYIDSDCIFYNQEKTISDYLSESISIYKNPLKMNKYIYIINDKPWSYTLPCTGFFILKSNSSTLNIFKNWYQNDIYKEYNSQHPFDQYSFQNYILPKYLNDIEIIDDWMFEQKESDQFLIHIGSHESEKRVPFFKEFITLNKIDVKNSLDQIELKTLIYDTNTLELGKTKWYRRGVIYKKIIRYLYSRSKYNFYVRR